MSTAEPITRRAMLRSSATAAAGLLVGGCALPLFTQSRTGVAVRQRRFAPVNVAADRVIRTLAGLRPFRPSGFVARAERLDDRLLVHNYGHGGGGITLSWGSSMLAAELAAASEHRRAAVIGCGIMGLSTARLLQDRGFDVTIYTRELPPNTTSNIAGGQWSPFTVHDADRVTPAYRAQFERAARISHAYFQPFAGAKYGVRWIENYVLSRGPFTPQPNPLGDLYPAGEELVRDEHPFPVPYVRRFTTMLVEPSIYLNALTEDYLLRGGRIVVREFRESRELLELDQPVIVNCTGLGARDLFGDEELIPIKGQLALLLPQPEVDYIILNSPFYMFPRTDGIVLGGTHERGEWSTEPEPETISRILHGNQTVFDHMRQW